MLSRFRVVAAAFESGFGVRSRANNTTSFPFPRRLEREDRRPEPGPLHGPPQFRTHTGVRYHFVFPPTPVICSNLYHPSDTRLRSISRSRLDCEDRLDRELMRVGCDPYIGVRHGIQPSTDGRDSPGARCSAATSGSRSMPNPGSSGTAITPS